MLILIFEINTVLVLSAVIFVSELLYSGISNLPQLSLAYICTMQLTLSVLHTIGAINNVYTSLMALNSVDHYMKVRIRHLHNYFLQPNCKQNFNSADYTKGKRGHSQAVQHVANGRQFGIPQRSALRPRGIDEEAPHIRSRLR